jgi:hypothetical protein
MMTMKKQILFILLAGTMLFGCKKDAKFFYDSTDNIYFNYPKKDTLTYSFAYDPTLVQDTVWIPVIISGRRSHQARNFTINAVDTATTATSPLHYVALKSTYTMPADSGVVKVPVILKNTDAALENKSVILTIRVSGNGDFTNNMPDSLRNKTILFSNRLEKPFWWNSWLDEVKEYGRTKHQLFLITSGTRDLIDYKTYGDPNFQIPRCLYYIENTRTFLRDPISWVQGHPEKGYTIMPKAGTKDYEFYYINSPTKRFLYKYFPEVGKSYFIDSETGAKVTME